LAVLFAGGAAIIVVGVFLMSVALNGYGAWGVGQRVIAFGLGAVDAVGMGALLALLWRQQVLGRPPVTVGVDGVGVGGHVIPCDDIARFSVYGLPHVVLAQSPSAPRGLHGLGRLHYMTRNGTRLVFLAERQLGQDVATGEAAIRMARLRYRPGPPPDTAGRDTDG
jgi:hypothetical protein